MELAERYTTGLKEFEKAFKGFEQALSIDVLNYNPIEADLLKNGCIQKFEYCGELAWKLSKVLLKWQTGQEYNSPKPVYRALFAEKYVREDLCKDLLFTIDERNNLSHIYKEELFDNVWQNLPKHVDTFLNLLEMLKSKLTY